MISDHSRTVFATLLLAQVLFVASTFTTWVVLFAVTGSIFLLVGMRYRSESTRLGSAKQKRAGLIVDRDMKTERDWKVDHWASGSRMRNGAVLLAGIVAILGSTFFWRVVGRVGENSNLILLGADYLGHSFLFLSIAIWALRPTRGHVSMLAFGITVMLLCVTAGGVSRSLAAQTTVGLAACIGFALGSELILGAQTRLSAATHGTEKSRESNREGSRWLGPLFATITLSLLLMVTSAVASVTERVLPGIQDDLRRQIQVSLDAVADQNYVGGMRYVSGSRLGSIRKHLTANPQQISLRIYSERAPGYLRGTVFDLYRSGRWYASGNLIDDGSNADMRDVNVFPTGWGKTSLVNNTGRALKRFPLVNRNVDANASSVHVPTTTLEIQNDPIKGQTIFAPLMTRWLEANSNELILSRHGVVRMGVDVTRPYVAGVAADLPSESIAAGRQQVLLDISPELQSILSTTVQSICEPSSPVKVKANAISRFFQQNFEYGLNRTRPPKNVDALSHFLATRHVAHCEYFASATVLMLRAANVPSRYVTGYVADESSEDDGRLWYARNRDAHAWAEAYDQSSQQWFAVESTPGRRYHAIQPLQDEQQTTDLSDNSDEGGASDQDTWFSRATGWLLSMRTTDTLLAVFRLAQLPLFCVLAILLWWKYFRIDRSASGTIDRQSRKLLGQVDRRTRKWSLIRRSHETLYQFSDRIMRKVNDQHDQLKPKRRTAMLEAAAWYRHYADARYQGELLVPRGWPPAATEKKVQETK